jgi:hypothetical protein
MHVLVSFVVAGTIPQANETSGMYILGCHSDRREESAFCRHRSTRLSRRNDASRNESIHVTVTSPLLAHTPREKWGTHLVQASDSVIKR